MLLGDLDREMVDFDKPVRDIVGKMGKALQGVHCARGKDDAGKMRSDGENSGLGSEWAE